MAAKWVFIIFGCSVIQVWSQDLSNSKTDPGYLAESEKFRFFSSFWLNYHHFLYLNAQARVKSPDNVLSDNLSDAERAALGEVLQYYMDHLIEHDLRMSGSMFQMKRWLVGFDLSDELPPNPTFAQDHLDHLNRCKGLYQRHFWPQHSAQNQGVLDANLTTIRAIEGEVSRRLENLCRASWQAEKIRVDISFHSKRERPYTTVRSTTHIVMDSGNNQHPAGNWIELLFHEASHQLIGFDHGFVGGTIQEAEEIAGEGRIRQLSHAFLFYISGVVTRDSLVPVYQADYEIYMKRKGVFKAYHSFLDKHLPAFLDGSVPLSAVTLRFIEDFRATSE